jgi:hypothetical protein
VDSKHRLHTGNEHRTPLTASMRHSGGMRPAGSDEAKKPTYLTIIQVNSGSLRGHKTSIKYPE